MLVQLIASVVFVVMGITGAHADEVRCVERCIDYKNSSTFEEKIVEIPVTVNAPGSKSAEEYLRQSSVNEKICRGAGLAPKVSDTGTFRALCN